MPKLYLILINLIIFFCSANPIFLGISLLDTLGMPSFYEQEDIKIKASNSSSIENETKTAKKPKKIKFWQKTFANNSLKKIEKELKKPKIEANKAEDCDNIEYWCTSENIVKLDPKQAEKLITSAKDKTEAAQKLIDQTMKIDKLDKMDPKTVKTFLWYKWDQAAIDEAQKKYHLDYSWCDINKITRK